MRDIKGFEGRYAITSCGRVWSYHKNDWLTTHKNNCGYEEVKLYVDASDRRHGYLVHRLVLETYNPVEGMKSLDASHKDEVRDHNYLNNLEWKTHKENCNYGTRNVKIALDMIGNKGGFRRVS